MNLSPAGLKSLCSANVVELKFTRRRPKAGFSPSRRMLCTLDITLLNSELGRGIFNYKAPSHTPSYSASRYGLVTVWDIIMQSWRNIPANAATVVTAVPTKPAEKFWEYFDKTIRPMSAEQKAVFMNK